MAGSATRMVIFLSISDMYMDKLEETSLSCKLSVNVGDQKLFSNGCTLLRDPRYNKGHAFTAKERYAHYLHGLLPPAVVFQDLQEKRLMHNLHQYEVPLHRYMAMMDLQERNEKLFYKLLINNVEELLPVVYTPMSTIDIYLKS